MRKVIFMPNGAKMKLARDFKVSKTTVYQALNDRINTPISKVLRRSALERGGVEIIVSN